jgi:hypothetical protein
MSSDPVVDAVSATLAAICSRRTGERWVAEPHRRQRHADGASGEVHVIAPPRDVDVVRPERVVA